MKSKVFTIAHQIKEFFANWSEALCAAWKITKLSFGYTVRLTFAKQTGEIREADAIAVSGLSSLSKGFFRFIEQVGDRTQWRSCRLERMISN